MTSRRDKAFEAPDRCALGVLPEAPQDLDTLEREIEDLWCCVLRDREWRRRTCSEWMPPGSYCEQVLVGGRRQRLELRVDAFELVVELRDA